MKKYVPVLALIFVFLFSFEIVFLGGRIYKSGENAANVYGFLDRRNELSENFDAKEKAHMEDVRRLIGMVHLLFAIFSLALVFLAWKQSIKNELIVGGWSAIIASAVICIFSLFDFELVFEGFHRAFFQSESWLFSGGILVETFNFGFFFWSFLWILILNVLFSLGIIYCFKKQSG